MSKKITFGTDGVRNIAGTKLSANMAMQLGQAAALCLSKPEKERERPAVFVGKDTRRSCDMLEMALCAGLNSMGVDAVRLGVIPTPGVAYLTELFEGNAGVMVSASHNSFEHNGLKLFGLGGKKLSDRQQEIIEAMLERDDLDQYFKEGTEIGRYYYRHIGVQSYAEHLASLVKDDLSGLKVVIDAANGAANSVLGPLLELLKLNCTVIGNEPNGRNINAGCGSTCPETLAAEVVAQGADIGIALDGDADRIIAVDENGGIVDGDQLLAIFGFDYKQRGLLRGNTIVGTVASNMGLHRFCEQNDIQLICTPVGDRHVMACMAEEGLLVGGEQAGHIILMDYAETGDGLLVGLQLLSVMVRTGKKLSELAAVMQKYPQVSKNLNVSEWTRSSFSDQAAYISELHEMKRLLGADGRILVRASGTEPLLRVMVEAPTPEMAERFAGKMADLLIRIDKEGQDMML